jgi:parvulin-like peptidyl-prolyl isomerase
MLPNRTIAALALILVASPAFAQSQDRYALEKSGDGFVRMDRQTGEMSYCTVEAGALACRAADGSAADRDAEIAKLQEAIAALDRRIVALENSLAARLESKLPTEEQFEQTMGYMERFLRGFMGIVRDMEKDEATGSGGAPGKT